MYVNIYWYMYMNVSRYKSYCRSRFTNSELVVNVLTPSFQFKNVERLSAFLVFSFSFYLAISPFFLKIHVIVFEQFSDFKTSYSPISVCYVIWGNHKCIWVHGNNGALKENRMTMWTTTKKIIWHFCSKVKGGDHDACIGPLKSY